MKKFKSFFSNLKNINPLNAVLILCGIILLGSVSVLFGYTLCNNGLIVASAKQNVGTYYLVEADCFTDYDEAVEFSKVVQAQGGAGYIRFDDGFHVFLSGYKSENDAKSVLNKLEEYENKKIYTLSIDEFNSDNGFSTNINNVIKNNIIAFKYSIENLNNVLIDFDKGEIDETKVKNTCVLILEELQQQIDKFMDNYWLNSTMLKYKNYIHEFYDMIDAVVNLEVSGVEFSSIVKYQEIGCMFKLQDILKIV